MAISVVIGGILVVVNIVGWFVVNCLAKKRELIARQNAASIAKETRINKFVSWLKHWRAEISSPGLQYLPYQPNQSIWVYREGLPDFHAQVALVQVDFPDKQRFDSLTKRIGNLKEEDWKNKQARDIILEALNELIKFAA
jgi:hypothetical protein